MIGDFAAFVSWTNFLIWELWSLVFSSLSKSILFWIIIIFSISIHSTTAKWLIVYCEKISFDATNNKTEYITAEYLTLLP